MPFTRILFIVFAALLMLLRWIFPEADPVWFKDLADFHDETWWAENARRKILFDTWYWDQYAGALAAGPLSALWHFLSFSFWGISFFSLRLIALVPATVAGIVLVKNRAFRFVEYPIPVLLLLSSTGLFAIARIGYLEWILLLILLLCIALSEVQQSYTAIILGFLLSAGLLVKGSFIYMAVPLLIYVGSFEKTSVRFTVLVVTTFIVMSVAAYVFYYLPNLHDFKAYNDALSQQYFSFKELVHPGGWLARLVWLTSKETFMYPFSSWILILLLLKWLNDGFPPLHKGISGLLVMSLLMALMSDFSDRRLVFFLVLPALALNQTYHKTNSFTRRFVFNFVLALPALQWFLHGNYGEEELLMVYVNPSLMLAAAIFFIMKLEDRYNKTNSMYLVSIATAGISACSLLYHSSLFWANNLNISAKPILFIQLLIFTILIATSFRFYKNVFAFTSATIVLLQTAVCVHALYYSTHDIRTTAIEVSADLQPGTRVEGNPAALELIFLSKAKNNMYASEKSNHADLPAIFLYKNLNNNHLTDSSRITFHSNWILLAPFGEKARLKYTFIDQ